jgi:hypothetical protein
MVEQKRFRHTSYRSMREPMDRYRRTEGIRQYAGVEKVDPDGSTPRVTFENLKWLTHIAGCQAHGFQRAQRIPFEANAPVLLET